MQILIFYEFTSDNICKFAINFVNLRKFKIMWEWLKNFFGYGKKEESANQPEASEQASKPQAEEGLEEEQQ